VISRGGVPQYEDASGGAYIEELLPEILDGVPTAYQHKADRAALKVLIKP
jgi:hypothetical protein